MRTKATFAAAVLVACLWRPAFGAQDLALFDPEQGVGGFVGTRTTIDQPVALSWGPRSGIIGTVETLSLLGGNDQESVVTTFTGAISTEDGGLNRHFAVSELSVNGHHITATRPLVVIDGWSDTRGGSIRNLEVTFPGFIEIDIAPPVPGTPQHQLWIDTFAADLPYAADPVEFGDPIFQMEPYHRLLEAQARSVIANPEADVIQNTFETRAHGIVQTEDGRALLAELSGRIEVRSGADRLIMEARGFGLIDLRSGLSSGTSRTLITAIRGGRTATRTVITDVQFLN